MKAYWGLLLLMSFIGDVYAKDINNKERDESKPCVPIQHTFVPHNVFSKDEPNYFWLLGLANDLHEVTRPSTLEFAMESFRECKSEIDPYEIERFFRRLPYIRDAKVRRIHDKDNNQLFIETWDNWTLQPNLSFGRKGGGNTWSIGAAEGNILGLGIASSFSYFANPDRTGYTFGVDTPVKLGYLLNTSFDISNNDDGYSQSFSIESPFTSKNTKWATAIQFNNESRQSGIRKNATQGIKFKHDIRYTNIWWGWSEIDPSSEMRHRFRIGFTSDKHQFTPLSNNINIPESREYSYPWFQYSLLSEHYTKMENIYLINSVEDINLGTNFWLRVGIDLSPSFSKVPYVWSMSVKKAARTSKNWLFALLINGEGNGLDNGKNRFVVEGISEFFYTPHKLFTLYGKLIFALSENEYMESPITLGDNTGLTGYPLQYSHGNQFFAYQEELRCYPGISLFQLIELGAAVFYGMGKTFGGGSKNNNNHLLHTAGLGLRFYSTRSSNGNTLYLDFSRPITHDPELNQWEWRLRGKSQF